jgi:phage-related protein
MAEYNTVFEQHNTWLEPFCCLHATKVAAYWTPPIGALIIGY